MEEADLRKKLLDHVWSKMLGPCKPKVSLYTLNANMILNNYKYSLIIKKKKLEIDRGVFTILAP